LGLPLDIDKRQALCATPQALKVVDRAPDKGQVGDTLGTVKLLGDRCYLIKIEIVHTTKYDRSDEPQERQKG
jgi:hypothetical protein